MNVNCPQPPEGFDSWDQYNAVINTAEDSWLNEYALELWREGDEWPN